MQNRIVESSLREKFLLAWWKQVSLATWSSVVCALVLRDHWITMCVGWLRKAVKHGDVNITPLFPVRWLVGLVNSWVFVGKGMGRAEGMPSSLSSSSAVPRQSVFSLALFLFVCVVARRLATLCFGGVIMCVVLFIALRASNESRTTVVWDVIKMVKTYLYHSESHGCVFLHDMLCFCICHILPWSYNVLTSFWSEVLVFYLWFYYFS